MIFENFNTKIENVILKEKNNDIYKKISTVFSNHYASGAFNRDSFLHFVNNLKKLELGLKISTVVDSEVSKCSIEFNDFSIFYEEKANNKGSILNYYIFKSEENHDIVAKVYCSILNNNNPLVTFETKSGELLFHYDVNDNFCFVKSFEPAHEQYSYAMNHFNEDSVNSYLSLNYDFESDSLINILRKTNKILN